MIPQFEPFHIKKNFAGGRFAASESTETIACRAAFHAEQDSGTCTMSGSGSVVSQEPKLQVDT